MDEFVDRTAELERLTSLYESSEAELAVIYGRRRLGKTELVKHSLRDRTDVVFYQARQKTRALQLDQFVERASATFSGITDIRREWEPLITYLAAQNATLVLDEFPYLIEEDESLPSVLQALFDHEFDDSSSTIVLVGSSISMMEEAALLGNSPLYGRASVKLDITQLPFDAAMEFFDQPYSHEEQILLWGIFGGTPYYLEEAATGESIGDAVFESILTQHGPLHDDPEFVLRMELTDPTRYFAILESIAGGATTRNEIAQAAGIDSNQLSKYLSRLERLRLVERHVPITERKERSRRGRYRLLDPLFRFWFRFVYGSGTRYDDLGQDSFSSLVEPELADFVSSEFERLCQRALRPLFPEQTLVDVGQWWYQEHEVDVVGLTNERTLVAGECKFQQSPVGYSAFAQLEGHVDELRWTPADGSDRICEYALFSRSGFEPSVEETAVDRDDLHLFDLDDVVAALERERS
ncbi:ATP-binding protein [Natronoglomus mannanivorans]|uniref:ATP-binding protein n=1 Tax=Natronoglomus mannanivorans TaxID=2979990 RepID=A0AAP2YZB6_9EURY|nr:ATP-binding protein [Halobacteria archaeon AArc-xg1-1]